MLKPFFGFHVLGCLHAMPIESARYFKAEGVAYTRSLEPSVCAIISIVSIVEERIPGDVCATESAHTFQCIPAVDYLYSCCLGE